MAKYQTRRNIVPHTINNLTILLNGEHKVEGLDLFEAELDEDEVTTQKVASGIGILNENPSLTGQIRINFLEASATTDAVYTILNSGETFTISALDEAAENFDVKGQQCRVMKRPVISRGAEATVSEWIFVAVYLDIKGGSYAVATP
jgi:hypothetical protein